MKELKNVLLVLVIGFGCSDLETTNFPNSCYPITIKGGFQTTPKHKPAKVAALEVEDNYLCGMGHLFYAKSPQDV